MELLFGYPVFFIKKTISLELGGLKFSNEIILNKEKVRATDTTFIWFFAFKNFIDFFLNFSLIFQSKLKLCQTNLI